MSAPGEHIVRGLRAAARATRRSASGVQKLIDAGRLPARRDGNVFAFALADLEAVRRAEPSAPIAAAGVSEAIPEITVPGPIPAVDRSDAGVQQASTPRQVDTDGVVAAQVFRDLQGGRTLVQIVAERQLAPDVVHRAYDQWLALSDVDTLRKPEAEARLAHVEADIQALDERLADIEGTVHEVSSAATRGRQEVDARLLTLSARSNGVSVPAAIYERLNVLEAQLRSMPAALLLLPERRCGCGAPLVVAASCSGCGAGRLAG